MNQTNEKPSDSVCPHCGYCKECGGGRDYWPPYYYPYTFYYRVTTTDPYFINGYSAVTNYAGETSNALS